VGTSAKPALKIRKWGWLQKILRGECAQDRQTRSGNRKNKAEKKVGVTRGGGKKKGKKRDLPKKDNKVKYKKQAGADLRSEYQVKRQDMLKRQHFRGEFHNLRTGLFPGLSSSSKA